VVDFDHERMGEHALLLRFGEGIDRAINARVHDACARLRAARIEGIEDIVPAYASVLLRLDPRGSDGGGTCDRGTRDFGIHGRMDRLLDRVRAVLAASGAPTGQRASPEHRLPVCYGGAHGADLAAVAEYLGLPPAAVIERHCAGEYTVAMLGFAPGFAYLLGMDPRLQVPRLERPRTRVPAGSVGIGGAQTGIYPAELPGGWQLIGRTPWRLFDPDREARPCRLAPGDRLRFEPIDATVFDRLQREDARW
jgi:KipI family sensor histidine kinase inhibitor